jgi:hypothetical protein
VRHTYVVVHSGVRSGKSYSVRSGDRGGHGRYGGHSRYGADTVTQSGMAQSSKAQSSKVVTAVSAVSADDTGFSYGKSHTHHRDNL